jgi:hypothetical protein
MTKDVFMIRQTIAVFVLLLVTPALRAEDDPSKAAQQYQELLAEYEQEGGARIFAERFLSFAEQHPDDPAAVDALLWVVANVRGRADTDSALKLLADHHTQSEKLAKGCLEIAQSRSAKAESLLRMLLEKSPHKSVQAHACYFLALLLDLEANIVQQLKAAPELAPRLVQYYGKEYGQHLSSLETAKLEEEREAVYQRLLTSFADMEVDDSNLGDVASKRLFRIRHLSVGKVAPDIQGEDIAGQSMKLSDYRGKIVMLSFWGHW